MGDRLGAESVIGLERNTQPGRRRRPRRPPRAPLRGARLARRELPAQGQGQGRALRRWRPL